MKFTYICVSSYLELHLYFPWSIVELTQKLDTKTMLVSFSQSDVGNNLNLHLEEDHRDVKGICIIIMENGSHS